MVVWDRYNFIQTIAQYAGKDKEQHGTFPLLKRSNMAIILEAFHWNESGNPEIEISVKGGK